MRSTAVVALALLGLAVAQPAGAALLTVFVDGPATGAPNTLGQYDVASVAVAIDPAQTNWVAWNTRASLTDFGPVCPLCLGGQLDDSVVITVTNPSGASAAVLFDANDGWARPFGPQNVIFGAAATTPDAWDRDFSNIVTIFNEGGAHNALFTTAGIYQFGFSFRNDFAGGAGHGDIWLLVDQVDRPVGVAEPGALTLTACALIGVWRRLNRRTAAA